MSNPIKLSTIVRLPDGKYAIVTHVLGDTITVNTGACELLYERRQLEYYGTIAIERKYTTFSGNQFARCVLNCTVVEVLTRNGRGGAAETRALEIRKLAFVQLMKERT
jgi:hypothetical protein